MYKNIPELTTKDIEKALTRREDGQFIRSVRCHLPHEIDFLSITPSKYAVEYEIKVSRSDFKADLKKIDKHHDLERGRLGKISRFYYVCPEGMIRPDEIPKNTGLIYVDKNLYCHEEVRAPRMKVPKTTRKDWDRIYRSMMYRYLSLQLKK